MFLAGLLAFNCGGGLTLTSMVPNPLAAMEKVACGLLTAPRWDTAAAHAAPSRLREENATGAHRGRERHEIIFIAVGMGTHSQFCFLLLIQSNMLSVTSKIAIFIMETLGPLFQDIYSLKTKN